MKLNETFSVDSLPQPTGNFDPIPEGWYTATINGAELKDTKAGTGQYINVRYDVIGEKHAGRVVFGMINVRNANPKAEEIGRQQLGELLRAIGKASVNDTDELLGSTLQIKVTVSQREGYDPRNEVRGFKATSGSMPKPAEDMPFAPEPKPDGKTKAPWEK